MKAGVKKRWSVLKVGKTEVLLFEGVLGLGYKKYTCVLFGKRLQSLIFCVLC